MGQGEASGEGRGGETTAVGVGVCEGAGSEML